MIRAKSEVATDAIHALFGGCDMPAGLRCRGVLEGHFPGEIFTDDLERPTWAIVRESSYGTLYPQGAVSNQVLTDLVNDLKSAGDVLIGYWPDDDDVVQILPAEPQYQGSVFDFTDLELDGSWQSSLARLTDGCAVRMLDEDLMPQSPWYQDRLERYGSLPAILDQEIGFGLVKRDILVSEATAAQIAKGVWEVGTITHPDHRRQGFATIVCAVLLKECVSRGLQTYWNCNKDNIASVALARKLGYRTQREYRLVGWFPPT